MCAGTYEGLEHHARQKHVDPSGLNLLDGLETDGRHIDVLPGL